jgi:RHS repeat-associated protein
VNFDDFKVTHTKTNVIQYNEYYPFGLQASTSWTRENNKNDFLYNAGSELNVTSGWYDLFFRNYDPALGRFMQVDPMATSEIATYQYAGNNPVVFNDPIGASRADYNRGYRLSLQFFASDGAELKGVPPGDGLGGGYIDWDASHAGPSADDIKQRDALRDQGYNAHFNAKGDVEIWEDESYIEWEYFYDDEGNL